MGNMEIARTLESNYKEMSFAPEIIVKEKIGVDLELEKLDTSEEENELISNGHDVNIEVTEDADDGDVKTNADEEQAQKKPNEENDIGELKTNSEQTEDNAGIKDNASVEDNNQVCDDEETTIPPALQHTEEPSQGDNLENTNDNISEVDAGAIDITDKEQQNDSAEMAVQNDEIEDKADVEETAEVHDDIIDDIKIIDDQNDTTAVAEAEPTTSPEESYVHIEAEEDGSNVPLPIDNEESINGHIDPVIEDIAVAASASCNEATAISDCHMNIPSHDDETTHESGSAMNGHIESEPDTSGQGEQGQEMEDELPESSPASLVNGSIVDVNELSTGEKVVKDEDTSDLLEETKQDEIN